MILDASLLNTQHYKLRMKVKWSNPEKGVAPPLHLIVVALEKGAFGSPLSTVGQLTLKPESIQENDRHKILLDFEIQTDHLISTRKPDLVMKKELIDFTVPTDHKKKIKENEKVEK